MLFTAPPPPFSLRECEGGGMGGEFYTPFHTGAWIRNTHSRLQIQMYLNLSQNYFGFVMRIGFSMRGWLVYTGRSTVEIA